MAAAKSLLRVVTTGSVDDGKSTLIGRLLYETRSVFEDQFEAARRVSERKGLAETDLALLLDGLAAEREQGITIDVAHRYFETATRKFILADCPGHEQYTRNMVTGASTADCAIVVMDARKGLLTQSRRHAFLVSLLRVPHLVVAVNKMDLVGYDEATFRRIVEDFTAFAERLELRDPAFIPVSALKGGNVAAKGSAMPWYEGPTLLRHLEGLQLVHDRNLIDFRFPVQLVLRPHQDFRGFAGRVASGTIRPGEEVVALPSGRNTRVKEVHGPDGPLAEAFAGQSVTLTLVDELDVSRGDLLARRRNLPTVGHRLEATVCWMDETPMDPAAPLLLKHTSRTVRAQVAHLHHAIEVDTLHRRPAATLTLNEIGRVELLTASPLFFDPYALNRATGAFILIDPHTHRTVGAGMIRGVAADPRSLAGAPEAPARATNLQAPHGGLPLEQREARNGHGAAVLWFTGLSGAGKSTLARALERRLFALGCQTTLLDGDHLRHGLCRDLGFTRAERSENIRRAGEVAKLLFGAGHLVLCTFISPFEEDRARARALFPEGRFLEVHVEAGVETCTRRDPHGLYQRALRGEIPDFTGISSPYEAPAAPELRLNTEQHDADVLVERLLSELRARGFLPSSPLSEPAP
ncbi:MAG TPA: adenylyl-sulfate kinase [Holophagaceae bacterium]|nr:adenylyl-sulfate kinase [Holophagaceae bacterium]